MPAGDPPPVRVERDGAVTVVTIARPEARNAVDRETAEALAAAFRAFEADADARVAVLRGEGGSFCAGADLTRVAAGEGNRVEPDGDGPMGPTRMRLSKPVIAAIDGHAVAGGLELALWCDLRVMEEDAVLGVFSRRWGVPLIDGGTARLPRLIGLSRALDLILTGRPVKADEALAIGLAHRVVPRGTVRASAVALAREIAAFPQACLRADRASAYDGIDLPLDEAMAAEFRRGVTVLGEAREGAGRFAAGQGRHGSFTDAEEEMNSRNDETIDPARPLRLDDEAESADPTRAAFLARPPDAPAYHGFPLVEETRTEDGWVYGAITDFAAHPDGATSGDGYVVAPDGRRAGLVWDVGEGELGEIAPPDETRWGVYVAWFPRRVRTVDDVVVCFRHVLPELRRVHARLFPPS